MSGLQDWQPHRDSAILRKHAGDIDGAIDEIKKAIRLTKAVPSLYEEAVIMLNYLADLYLSKEANEQAEEAIQDAVELSRHVNSDHLADNLWILAEVRNRKCEYREAIASAEEALHLYQYRGHSHGVVQTEELIERIKANLANDEI